MLLEIGLKTWVWLVQKSSQQNISLGLYKSTDKYKLSQKHFCRLTQDPQSCWASSVSNSFAASSSICPTVGKQPAPRMINSIWGSGFTSQWVMYFPVWCFVDWFFRVKIAKAATHLQCFYLCQVIFKNTTWTSGYTEPNTSSVTDETPLSPSYTKELSSWIRFSNVYLSI